MTCSHPGGAVSGRRVGGTASRAWQLSREHVGAGGGGDLAGDPPGRSALVVWLLGQETGKEGAGGGGGSLDLGRDSNRVG